MQFGGYFIAIQYIRCSYALVMCITKTFRIIITAPHIHDMNIIYHDMTSHTLLTC